MCIRDSYWNLRERGVKSAWVLPASAILIFSIAFFTIPKPKEGLKFEGDVKFSEVQFIVAQRCTACHSTNPTDEDNQTAPNGVMFDNADEIINKADEVLNRAVLTQTMPPANKTGMTDLERAKIARWIELGAKAD